MTVYQCKTRNAAIDLLFNLVKDGKVTEWCTGGAINPLENRFTGPNTCYVILNNEHLAKTTYEFLTGAIGLQEETFIIYEKKTLAIDDLLKRRKL